MILPLRGGDFQGIAGLSSDDSLLAENQNEGCQGPLRTKRLPSLTGGLEVKLLFSTSGRGRNIFLDIPLYRHCTTLRFCFAFLGDFECYRDITPFDELTNVH